MSNLVRVANAVVLCLLSDFQVTKLFLYFFQTKVFPKYPYKINAQGSSIAHMWPAGSDELIFSILVFLLYKINFTLNVEFSEVDNITKLNIKSFSSRLKIASMLPVLFKKATIMGLVDAGKTFGIFLFS